MSDIPQKDEDRIDPPHDETLMIPIAEILYSKDRAWYTKNQIGTRLRENYNQDPSNPTIGERLDTLLELEIIDRKRIGQTDIYYYLKGSEWPIPPDVEVEPTNDELTVREILGRFYVQLAGVSIFAILLGGIVVWIGSLNSTNVIALPWESSEILAIGLLLFIFSYAFILIALALGIMDYSMDSESPDWLS